MTLDELKKEGQAPEWLSDEGYKVLCSGYLLEDETPKKAYQRVAKAAAQYLPDSDQYERDFFELIWNNWLCPSTPVMANMGAKRGLPISCFGSYAPDSLSGIMDTNKEIAMMSKYGGGTSAYLNDLRASGAGVHGTGGTSSGVVSWAKIMDSTIASVSQGPRRGALAVYLDADHTDAEDFLRIRRPEGDPNRQCLNLHQGVILSDKFMKAAKETNGRERALYKTILKTRVETGEPYIFFKDTVKRSDPQWYADAGWSTKMSNLCTEIFLATDEFHSFVCCLSSMNLARYDEWKNTTAVQTAIIFLDCVMEEFIRKAKALVGMERAVNFAEKSRALGLGVLGYHTLLQRKGFAFDSFDAMMINSEIFSGMKKNADIATRELAQKLGEPELMVGTGRRNSHLMAVAPTVSNSTISGNVSPGIEPIVANAWVKKSSKGTFIQYNPELIKLLESKNQNTDEVWLSIVKNEGSVQQLNFLTEEEKAVYLTAREINQFAIIKQAAQRQPFIDQGQSVNLFFASNSSPEYIHKVHWMAWEEGLKSLYYFRSSSPLRADLASRSENECKACEG